MGLVVGIEVLGGFVTLMVVGYGRASCLGGLAFRLIWGIRWVGEIRVRLWHDRWCGDVTLKESFHVLYDCASNQAATISEVLVRENGRVDWHVTFVRNFNDWELDIIASYLGLLQSHLPSRKVDDGLRWNLKKKGISIPLYCLKRVPYYSLPLEEYLAYQSPSYGMLLCLDSGVEQNLNFWKS